jgi:hypothetical protein
MKKLLAIAPILLVGCATVPKRNYDSALEPGKVDTSRFVRRDEMERKFDLFAQSVREEMNRRYKKMNEDIEAKFGHMIP